uniref:Putative secreted protein n=1 Tax=Amblyomma triste TaxID=251400 RepID=A0A023G4V5_AMBTT
MARLCLFIAFALAAFVCGAAGAKKITAAKDIVQDEELIKTLAQTALQEQNDAQGVTTYFWWLFVKILNAVVKILNSIVEAVVEIQFETKNLECGTSCAYASINEKDLKADNCTAEIKYNTKTKQHEVLSLDCKKAKTKRGKKKKN